MKEKELVQSVRDTDPEMKELWPMVEEVLDEMEALKLRNPALSKRIEGIQEELAEFKQNSRRILAFHKDLSQIKRSVETLSEAEDPNYNTECSWWDSKNKTSVAVPAPPGMYYANRYASSAKEIPAAYERPAPGTARKAQDAYNKLRKRTSELLKIRKKSDPLLKEPLYKVVLDRLAGKTFTALEGARVGYQVQLERGQRPTSHSARMRKAMDVRNFEYDHVLPKVATGLTRNTSTGTYTLAKNYTLKERAKKPSGEVLVRMKKELGELAKKLQALQQKTGISHYHPGQYDPEGKYGYPDWHAFWDGKKHDQAGYDAATKRWYAEHPDLHEMTHLQDKIRKLTLEMSTPTIRSALKDVGLRYEIDERYNMRGMLVPV